MKKYTITVNGTAYDVVVEENGSAASTSAAPAPAAAPAPQAAPAPETASAAAPASAGSVEVCSGVAGKVFRIEAPVGTAVKAGDAVVVVEAMKMEIPVVAPQDGTVASIECAVGDACEAGTLLATLN